jgi:hypothetical protein
LMPGRKRVQRLGHTLPAVKVSPMPILLSSLTAEVGENSEEFN